MASATIPAFYMVGSKGRDVLLGGKDGLYQFDQRLQLSTKTADGVGLVLNAINKGEKGTDLSLKSSYRCVCGVMDTGESRAGNDDERNRLPPRSVLLLLMMPRHRVAVLLGVSLLALDTRRPRRPSRRTV